MQSNKTYTDRLVNPTKSFEEGGILPQPAGGVRLRSVNNLRVLKNESVSGGANITISWLEDNASVSENTYFEINVYTGGRSGTRFSTSQNLNSTDISQLTPAKTISKVKKAPVEIFVPTNVDTLVIISVTLRHSSGIISLSSFTSTCTCMVKPLGSLLVRTTATTFTMSKEKEQFLLVDGSANTTVNLPPISEVIDGFSHTVKLISSSVITVTVTPNGSDTIENGSTAQLNSRYGTITIVAEKGSKIWWIKSRLP